MKVPISETRSAIRRLRNVGTRNGRLRPADSRTTGSFSFLITNLVCPLSFLGIRDSNGRPGRTYSRVNQRQSPGILLGKPIVDRASGEKINLRFVPQSFEKKPQTNAPSVPRRQTLRRAPGTLRRLFGPVR